MKTITDDDGTFITIEALAEELKISYENCKYRLSSRKIKFVKRYGRLNLYDPSVLEEIRLEGE